MTTPSTNAVSHAAIKAELNLVKRMLFLNALVGNQSLVTLAQAIISTLNSLLNGKADQALAFHTLKGGYYVPASWQAAWAALPVGIENYTLAQVQEFLRVNGVQLAADDVADFDVDAIGRLEDGKVTALDLHNEHDALAADLHDGAGLHVVTPLVKTPNVAESPA
jgi:hypothetical protein